MSGHIPVPVIESKSSESKGNGGAKYSGTFISIPRPVTTSGESALTGPDIDCMFMIGGDIDGLGGAGVTGTDDTPIFVSSRSSVFWLVGETDFDFETPRL